jgi:hypothetical protein
MSAAPRRAKERSGHVSVRPAQGVDDASESRGDVLGRATGHELSKDSRRPGGKRATANGGRPAPLKSDGRHDPGGWLFRLELVDCGKGESGRCRKCADGPSHGPYWYRYRWSDGKMHKRYVGKTLPLSASAEEPTQNSFDDPARQT